jgi:ParB family chromosome partitioning protein
MNEKESAKIVFIPIKKIKIINPRNRNPDKFRLVRENIANVGLKKPIIVSQRGNDEDDPKGGYDLVCGQGRIEAYLAHGKTEIPAIVINVPRVDRLLMSLVENMARRHLSAVEQLGEIIRLKEAGHGFREIARKLGFAEAYVRELFALLEAKEERLLAAVLGGRLPITLATAIARTTDVEAQAVLLKACEEGKLKQKSLRQARTIIEQRRFLGKTQHRMQGGKRDVGATARSVVAAFQKGNDQLKSVVRKARTCEARLAFVTTALKRLFTNENFTTLLRAEKLEDLPEYLAQRIIRTPSSP